MTTRELIRLSILLGKLYEEPGLAPDEEYAVVQARRITNDRLDAREASDGQRL